MTDLRATYLDRLGLAAEPPSIEGLFRIQRAHVERVPYETLWIHLGERWGIDLDTSYERIARTGRGGYCLHLNGGLGELLQRLGYRVERHVGGVHGPVGPVEQEMTNHLVLTVHDLPGEANPGGTWYVDAGLGDALHEPLPLMPGSYQQGPFHLALEQTPGGVGDWHLTHDPAGGFSGMAWRTAPAEMDDFVARHEQMSTSPDSGFVRVLTVQRRDATGVDVLRGLTWKRIGASAHESTLTSHDELVEVLRDPLGIDVDQIAREAFDHLWTTTHRGHLEWEAAGRP